MIVYVFYNKLELDGVHLLMLLWGSCTTQVTDQYVILRFVDRNPLLMETEAMLGLSEMSTVLTVARPGGLQSGCAMSHVILWKLARWCFGEDHGETNWSLLQPQFDKPWLVLIIINHHAPLALGPVNISWKSLFFWGKNWNSINILFIFIYYSVIK